MTEVLLPAEIAARFAELALVPGAHRDDASSGAIVYRGKLPSRSIGVRPATVRVAVAEDGILTASLLVPGVGGLTTSFSLFADMATDEVIERYLGTYLNRHETAVRELAVEIEAGKYL